MSKEEPKKETFEEAAKKFADDCTLVSDAAAYKGFIEGAKWQQDMADNWLTMKEGDITVNFKPMPEFDEPAYPTRLDQLKEQAWDVIYQKFIKDTDGISSLALLEYLKDNYNPPTKKQDNDK